MVCVTDRKEVERTYTLNTLHLLALKGLMSESWRNTRKEKTKQNKLFPLQTLQDGACELRSVPPQMTIIYPSPIPNELIHNSQQHVIIQIGYDRISKNVL